VDDKNGDAWLNAAQCAARTGVTVRALRIYESHGLIEPLRGENGWRHYGRKEVIRLNNIALLKAAGLTLTQIGNVFDAGEPCLSDLLHQQIETWKRRKEEVEAGLTFTETMLKRLQSRQSLSIDELCQMVKYFGLSNLGVVIDDHVPVQEQRRWNDWWTNHADATADVAAYTEVHKIEVLLPMIALMRAGADPSSPQVQDLIALENRLMTRYGIREAAVQASDAAPLAGSKMTEIARDMTKEAEQYQEEAVQISIGLTSGLSEFNMAARLQSPLYQMLQDMCREFAKLHETPRGPSAPRLDAAVERFRKLCHDYDLGKPEVYARWCRILEPGWAADCGNDPRAVWNFIVQALEP